MTSAHPGRERRLGLRARISVVFALLALVLSAAIAISAWVVVRSSLLTERQTSSVAEASVNAAATDRLLDLEFEVPQILDNLPGKDSAAVLVLHDGVWTGNTPQVSEEHLPEGLVEAAVGGEAGHAAYVEPALGTEVLAVAQPMSGGDVLVELFPLDPEQTMIRRVAWARPRRACSASEASVVGLSKVGMDSS